MPVQWAATTHPGIRRTSNEDSYCSRPDLGLFIVADGMGGHVAGEVASKIAVDAIEAFIGDTHSEDSGLTWPHPIDPALGIDGSRLKSAFHLANKRLADEVAAAVDLRGMATTASTVLLKDERKAMLAHVGDSRIYLFRDNELERMTNDHSWVEEQMRAGLLSPLEARQHPWRNVVTRALSGGEDPEVDVKEVALQPGDRLLLCSDGLSSVVPDERIEEIMRQQPVPDAACQALVDEANAGGGPDNVTTLILQSMLHNLRQLLRYRGLIQSLVARELKARYRGSVLGFFWSFINPLLLLSIYSFVFAVVLPGTHPAEIEPYALFMFCGILPWTWFASSLSESANVLIGHGNLIKKVLFPAEILPIVTVLANMVHFFLGLPILIGFLIYYWRPLTLVELAWFPVVVFVQALLTTALALILSALTVHFRDIKDLLANLLTFWFFATPIIYPMSQATGTAGSYAKTLLDLNPMTHIAISYQEILFYPGPFGHWQWLLALGGGSAVLFLIGYFLFDRLRDSFAEEV